MYIFQKAHGALTYLPLLASKAVKVGTALKMSASGGLDLCGATDKPRYISNAETTGDGSLIPVSEITEDTVLIAPLGAAASAIGIGKKFKLHTDAASVGAAAGGCLEVASFDGKAAGDLVIFRVVDADPTTSS